MTTVDREASEKFEVLTARMVTLAHVPVVHGLKQHTLRLGLVVLDMYERGLTLEAMPLVRCMYEFSITAQWVADSKEAPLAFFNEDVRQRQQLSKTMARSASQTFREHAPNLAHIHDEVLDTIAGNQAQWFKARCLALAPVGEHGYALYRAMSAYCHPSASVADHYLTPTTEGLSGMKLKGVPEQIDYDAWLFLAVASMLWAARALDVMDRASPHRSYLRRLARRLEIPDVLRLTPEARQAEAQAEAARRQAQRKGPRPRKSRDRKASPEARQDD